VTPPPDEPTAAPPLFDTRGETPLGRTYIAVILVEAVTLAALWFFSSHFSG